MPSRRFDSRDLPASSPLASLLRPRGAPITIELDGRSLDAFDGEPLAVSLLANGVHTLARSIKFHRPRGPACLRANCEGCLVRIDDVPNVMACRAVAHAGSRVQSQNAFPSASVDVLRVTDWFFPKRFDHHHLMVQFGSTLNRTMQVFARRMAGLGTLPESEGPTPDVEHHSVDVLVVGGGPSGLAAAATLARAGLRVMLCEEEPLLGGTLQDELGTIANASMGPALASRLEARAREAGVDIRTSACVSATFDNATVVITPDRALRIEARVRLFANGSHELIGTFESNDLPGVYTARAAARALRYGVMLGERCVIAGRAWPGDALANSLRDAGVEVTVVDETLVGVDGTGSVSHARVRDANGRERRLRCDAVLVADEATPAYELLGQSGVEIDPDEIHRCFAPRVDADGATERRDVFATGSVRGVTAPFTRIDSNDVLASDGAIADGVRVAKRIIATVNEVRS